MWASDGFQASGKSAAIRRRPSMWARPSLIGIDRDQLAGLAVFDREFGVGRIADGFAGVEAVEQAGDLQLDLVLVGPEPRHRIVGLRLAHDRLRRGLGLIDGVLHAFEPDLAAIALREEPRAIADRIDVRRGAGEVVDHDAVLARQARGRREIVVGAGAGRDQHEIGGDALAGRERDAGRAALALDRGKPRAEPDIDAARAVQRIEEGGHGLAGDALHHPALGLDHDRLAALLAHDGRDLEADIAAADDDDAARVIERRAQTPDIVDLAERKHAGKLDAGQRQVARARAGGENQRVVVMAAAVAAG